MSWTILCGLASEAALFAGKQPLDVQLLWGSAQRDRLANLVTSDCKGILSFGVCGALDPGLQLGDLVVASGVTVLPSTQKISADGAWALRLSKGLGARIAPFASGVAPLTTPAAKRSLWVSSGAGAADEETWAVALFARARGIPWCALRSPSDLAGDSVALSGVALTRADGTNDIPAVLGGLLRQPWALPGLLRNAYGYGQALAALGHAVPRLSPP